MHERGTFVVHKPAQKMAVFSESVGAKLKFKQMAGWRILDSDVEATAAACRN